MQWFHKRFPGWQANACGAVVLTTTVFLVNFLLLVVLASKPQQEWNNFWTVTVRRGGCNAVKHWSEFFQILVNVLSTVSTFVQTCQRSESHWICQALLASANYFMQLVAAPTRGDVDAAHARGEW